MPDTTWPVGRHPPGSSRGHKPSPVSMPHVVFRHVISGSLALAFVIHTCRAQRRDFSATLTTPALDRRSSRWFGASPCRAAPEGQTSISCTAPHPVTWSSTSSLLQRSWSHVCATASRESSSERRCTSNRARKRKSMLGIVSRHNVRAKIAHLQGFKVSQPDSNRRPPGPQLRALPALQHGNAALRGLEDPSVTPRYPGFLGTGSPPSPKLRVPIPRGHPGAAGTDNSEPVLDAGSLLR
jgi:hypothetical protein